MNGLNDNGTPKEENSLAGLSQLNKSKRPFCHSNDLSNLSFLSNLMAAQTYGFDDYSGHKQDMINDTMTEFDKNIYRLGLAAICTLLNGNDNNSQNSNLANTEIESLMRQKLRNNRNNNNNDRDDSEVPNDELERQQEQEQEEQERDERQNKKRKIGGSASSLLCSVEIDMVDRTVMNKKKNEQMVEQDGGGGEFNIQDLVNEKRCNKEMKIDFLSCIFLYLSFDDIWDNVCNVCQLFRRCVVGPNYDFNKYSAKLKGKNNGSVDNGNVELKSNNFWHYYSFPIQVQQSFSNKYFYSFFDNCQSLWYHCSNLRFVFQEVLSLCCCVVLLCIFDFASYIFDRGVVTVM